MRRNRDQAKKKKRQARRFNFRALPKMTKEQVRVVNRMMAFLPQTPFEKEFKSNLRAALEPVVRADIDFWFNSISHVSSEKLASHMADPTCIVRVGLLPHEEEILCEFDLVVAQQSINRLLGASEQADSARPLSDIEEGVFGFVVLKVLEQIQSGFAHEQQLALKMKGMHGNAQHAVAQSVEASEWTCLAFKVFFDLHVGFLRLYIPSHFIERTFVVNNHPEGPALSRAMNALVDREKRIASIDTDIAVELGRIAFTPDDIQALDVGDIVLLDQPKVTIMNDVVSGQVDCRIGAGKSGFIIGNLAHGPTGRYEVAIEQIVPAGVPENGGGFSDDEPMAEEEHSHAHPESMHEVIMNKAFQMGDVAVMPSDRDAVAEPSAQHNEEENEYEEQAYDEQDEGGFEEEVLPESAGLLDDVNVAMVIELGRVQVTAADVLQVRPGQIIEHRSHRR